MFNNNEFSKSSFFLNKGVNSDNKSKYSYLQFYGKEGFISFALNNQNIFNYRQIIKEEISNLYNEVIKLNHEEINYFGKSSSLLMDYSKLSNQSNKNLNLLKNSKKNDSSLSEKSDKIIVANIESRCQLYLLIGISLYNYNNKTSNIENKNGLNKAINSQENNSHEINHCNTFKKNSFTKFPSKIFFNCDSQNNFDNIFIFKLFLFAFRKNQNEFPRNLFFVTLNRYSLEELKRIGKTNVKYIDKTIQCQIRKIEKISYKELVISNDSDNDEIIEEEPHSLPNSKNFNVILGPIRKVDRKKSLKTLYKIEDFINLNEETKEEKENNVQKTKVNVVDNLDSSFNNMLNLNPNQKSLSTIRNIYIQRKVSNKQNSWNCLDLNNYPPLNNNSNDNINLNNLNMNIDPMVISEQICTKLYFI